TPNHFGWPKTDELIQRRKRTVICFGQTGVTNLSLKLEPFSFLTLARYEFRLLAREEAELPALLGSTLRVAFGHALKAIACSVSHQDCSRCFLRDVFIYLTFFKERVGDRRNLLSNNQSEPVRYNFLLSVTAAARRIGGRTTRGNQERGSRDLASAHTSARARSRRNARDARLPAAI